VHETAGEGPLAFVGFSTAFNQEDFQLDAVKSEYHTVRRNGWMRILVTVSLVYHNFLGIIYATKISA
jgi:hypothetical protein